MAHSERLPECEDLKVRIEQHIDESVSVRDRLTKLELQVDLLEKAVMRNAIIGGIIGALIGSGCAPAITTLVDHFIK